MPPTTVSMCSILRHLQTVEYDRLEAIVGRFEAEWRDGSRPSIDDFLLPDETERAALLKELVLIELELRLSAGESARVDRKSVV